jgi:hypothetical protein
MPLPFFTCSTQCSTQQQNDLKKMVKFPRSYLLWSASKTKPPINEESSDDEQQQQQDDDDGAQEGVISFAGDTTGGNSSASGGDNGAQPPATPGGAFPKDEFNALIGTPGAMFQSLTSSSELCRVIIDTHIIIIRSE